MDRHFRSGRPRPSGDPICQGHGLMVCAVDIDNGKLSHAKQRQGRRPGRRRKEGNRRRSAWRSDYGAPLSAFKQAVGMTRKRGTCVLVGLPPGEFPVPLFDVVANCITIRGSFVGTRKDVAEALAFAAAGKVKADIELQPLSSIIHHVILFECPLCFALQLRKLTRQSSALRGISRTQLVDGFQAGLDAEARYDLWQLVTEASIYG